MRSLLLCKHSEQCDKDGRFEVNIDPIVFLMRRLGVAVLPVKWVAIRPLQRAFVLVPVLYDNSSRMAYC